MSEYPKKRKRSNAYRKTTPYPSGQLNFNGRDLSIKHQAAPMVMMVMVIMVVVVMVMMASVGCALNGRRSESNEEKYELWGKCDHVVVVWWRVKSWDP